MALDREHVRLLARLRRMPRLTVCEWESDLWLRGEEEDEAIAPQLATIPGARRFAVLADKQLRPMGRLVPEGHLPEGPWRPLDVWLQVELPPAASGSSSKLNVEPVPLRLVRTGEVREPALLEVSLSILAEYVETAPQWRIQRWQLALSRDGAARTPSALVRGLPLPPLPGQLWVEAEGICVPAGYAWQPAVNAAVVRQLLGLEPQQLALLDPAGTHEIVMPDHWVRASRSAVRQMWQEARP
ncbi:MAG: hypothetical protein ACR2FY_18830 [Pirellulaceae bacterium]